MGAAPKPANAGEAVIAALKARRLVDEKVMVVAAHPDDETIGIGAQLCRLKNALILHVTDGAPRDGRDMARYGFSSIEEYAASRRVELANALEAGGVADARTLTFDIPDQEACRHLAELTRRIAELFDSETPCAVFTHAYEGGHPDHDAAAFAVHAACRLLPPKSAPAIIEMALYHRQGGHLVNGEFIAADRPVTPVPLNEDDTGRKRRMIDCFTTQRWLLATFPVDYERLRAAPEYDFRAPPHPGKLHYETLGWNIDGAGWRQCASEALARLGLARATCL
jgi:LmbE family N-acetylglucosaminyl deacetylase